MRIPRKTVVWLLILCCVVSSVGFFKHYWTPPWLIADLSMRFCHPELYDSRDGLPMYTALYEFRRRGLLHRGMAAIEIRKLLGNPAEKSELQTGDDNPNLLWVYDLHASTLVIEFTNDGTALSFTETSDGDNSK